MQGLPPNTFAPHQIPILHGNSYAPTGQPNNVIRNYASRLGLSGFSPNYNEYPDCQAGQTGYPLGNFPAPGQAPVEPGASPARTCPAPAASPTSSGTRTASAC